MNKKQQEEQIKLQEVGAYATYHKTDQMQVPLLSAEPASPGGKRMEDHQEKK